MGDAGDEVADVFGAGERRQGFAEGFCTVERGIDVALALVGGDLANAGVGLAAACDGGVFGGWADFAGIGLWKWSLRELDHGFFSLGGWVATAFLYCSPREGNYMQNWRRFFGAEGRSVDSGQCSVDSGQCSVTAR